MKIKNTLVLLLASCSMAYSQDFSSYYSYILNRMNINSAYTGSTEKIEIDLNSRSMLTGVKGGPRNLMFGAHSSLKGNQGVGVKVIHDTRGIFEVTRADLMYAHRFYLKNDMYIRFGLTAGILNRSINSANLNTDNSDFDGSDPTTSGTSFNSLRFVSGFGLLYDYKGLVIGFSAPHIIESASEISQHLVGMASYKIKSSNFTFEPMLYYQNFKNTPNVLDALLNIDFKSKVNGLVGYSNNNRVKGGIGFNLNGFGLNYLYEHSTGSLNDLSPNSHELMLTISLNKKNKARASSKTEKELDQLLSYVSSLVKDEKTYTKDFLREEIDKIHKQLDTIMKDNNAKNSSEVADKLQLIETQINTLLSKYN